MKLEEIIAKLKGENKTDEEIKQAVETLKKEIDDFLNASEDKTTVAIRDGGEQNYRSGENARNPCVYCGKHGVFTFTISPRSSEKRGKLKNGSNKQFCVY